MQLVFPCGKLPEFFPMGKKIRLGQQNVTQKKKRKYKCNQLIKSCVRVLQEDEELQKVPAEDPWECELTSRATSWWPTPTMGSSG